MGETSYKLRNSRGNIISNAYNSVKSYFGVIPLLGTATGTGVGYWGAFLGTSVQDFLFNRLPYISNWNWENVQNYLHSSLRQGYDAAGEWALIGAVAGLLLTNKFKKSIISLIKK